MSATRNPAETGIWKDYTTGDISLVVPAAGAFFIVAWAGVWLSLSVRYVKKVLGNAALSAHLWWYTRPDTIGRDAFATESTGLLSAESSQAAMRRAQPLAQILKETNGVRDLFRELFFTEKALSWPHRLRLIIYTALVCSAALGMIIGGILSAKMKTTGPAKIASEKCGLWVFDREHGGDEAATRAGLLELHKEGRAAEYADDCYGKSSNLESARCDLFYRPRLPFSSASYTMDCPFDNSICRQNQTVTFTTPMIDASDIGINSPDTPKFYRNTSCTPLSMNYPYIQDRTINGTTTYYYYYGQKGQKGEDGGTVNYTYTTVGNPWDRIAPVYDVFAYTSNKETTNEMYWTPRSELTYPEHSTLTIFFVSSLRILYKKRSDDPIFPADEEYKQPGEQTAWFRNSNPRARPFACINSIMICAPDETSCWSYNAPDDTTNVTYTPEMVLLYTSLYKTDIIDSIAKRLGRALLAQELVSQYYSDALNDDHWVDEIESLVATAHARTQLNAWSVASGEDSIHEGKDGFISLTEKYGDVCGKYKYNPQGYASIRFKALILICLSFPLFWFLSLDWNPLAKGARKLWERSSFKFPQFMTTGSSQEAGQVEAENSEDVQITGQLSAQEPSTPPQVGADSPSADAHEELARRLSQPTHDESTGSSAGEPIKSDLEVRWEPLVYLKIFNFVVFLLRLILSTVVRLVVLFFNLALIVRHRDHA